MSIAGHYSVKETGHIKNTIPTERIRTFIEIVIVIITDTQELIISCSYQVPGVVP